MLEKAGIRYFDFKSENIIYDKNKNIPIIIDFGLSFLLIPANMEVAKSLVNTYFMFMNQNIIVAY